MELMIETGIVKPARLQSLLHEAGELTAIAVSSIKTSKQNQKRKLRHE
jgi:hypothetical protein